MSKVLIVYSTHGGNTRRMAEAFAKALQGHGLTAALLRAKEAQPADLAAADALLLGSPCYFGNVSAEVKDLIDRSVVLFGAGALDGKPAGAFVSTGGIGGCGELALAALVHALLIHGMVVKGLREGGHLGPLAIGDPDERVLGEIERYAAQFADLVKRLAA